MPLKIQFKVNGTWVGGGRIPPPVCDISNLPAWIHNFLKLFKHLGKTYENLAHNDGELVGQEKANLVIELDGLIGGLIILRQYLTEKNPNVFKSLSNKYKFSFSIRIDANTWSGRGRMSYKYTFKLTSFANWYNNIMMKKIQQVFIKYSEAMADGVLSKEERENLILFVETIIFDVLVIERVLISTTLNK